MFLSKAHAAATSLRIPRTVEVGTCVNYPIEASAAWQSADLWESTGNSGECRFKDSAPSRSSRQRHGHDGVSPRQQRSVNGLWEVTGGDEQYVRTTIRQMVELGEYCIGRAMHVDRIRIHAQA